MIKKITAVFGLTVITSVEAGVITYDYQYENDPVDITGAYSAVLDDGVQVVGPTDRIGQSEFSDYALSNLNLTVEKSIFDLRAFTDFENFKLNATEYKAMSYALLGDVDGSRTQAQDPLNVSRSLNNIEIVGNAETANSPRTRFAFVGIDGKLNGTSTDHSMSIERLSLTNVDLVSADFAGTREDFPGTTCFTSPSCYGGYIDINVGGGANHTQGIIELNNASIDATANVNLSNRPVDFYVGSGVNSWVGNISANESSARVFNVVGTQNNRSELTLSDHSGRNNVIDFGAMSTSSSYFYLGSQATLSYADLILNSVSLSAPTNGSWSVTDSTITLTNASSDLSTLRTGEFSMTRSSLILDGSNPWVYIGHQNSGTSFVMENSQIDASSSTGAQVYIQSETHFYGDNVLLEGDGTMTLGNASNTVESGRLIMDGIDVFNLTVDAGASVVYVGSGNVVSGVQNINFQGDFAGTIDFSGAAGLNQGVTFNGMFDPALYSYSNGSLNKISDFGEVNFINTPVNFGANGVHKADIKVLNIGGITAFQNDLIQTLNADVNSWTNIDINFTNDSAVVSATELDGKQLLLVGLYKDTLGFGDAQLLQDTSMINAQLGPNVPALVQVNFIDDATQHGQSATIEGTPAEQTANITAVFTTAPVSSLATHSSLSSSNQAQAVDWLTLTPSVDPVISQGVNYLTNGQIAGHLSSVHPEPYSSYMTVSLEQTEAIMNKVLANSSSQGLFTTARTNQEAVESIEGDRVWFVASHFDGSVDGNNGLGSFDYDIQDVTIGGDISGSEDGFMGGFVSLSQQQLKEHDTADQELDGKALSVGLYLNQEGINIWDIRSVVGYSFGQHESDRVAQLGTIREESTAEFDSHSLFFGVEGSFTAYKADWIRLAPVVGFNYVYHKQDSFSEKGGNSLALDVDAAYAKAIVLNAGVNAEFASLSNSFSVYPLASVNFAHDFYAKNNDEHEIDAALISNPGNYQRFVGQNRGANIWSTAVGLGSDVNQSWKINGALQYSNSENGSEKAFWFAATYVF